MGFSSIQLCKTRFIPNVYSLPVRAKGWVRKLSISTDESNPSDESVEKSIREEGRRLDRRKNSIVPEFMENDGVAPDEEVSRDMEIKEGQEEINEERDFYDLSSDKEEDTTEGEITDTNTST